MPKAPKTFQDVVRVVHSPGELSHEAYVAGVRAKGFMNCPSPSWDANSSYRIAFNGKHLEIQRLMDGAWQPSPLSPEAKLPSTDPTRMQTKTRTILFMDVAGWSKLQAHEIHGYATRALPELAKALTNHEFVNTWGDAIVATFDSVKNAAESALRIRDTFLNGYPEQGIPVGLTCRISLHLGEVILCDNPLRQSPDIFGNAVHVAARLEPETIPGEIFCTRAVAEKLADVAGSAPRAWPAGEVVLPKGAGRIEVFVVTSPNAPQPRLVAVVAETAKVSQPASAHLSASDDVVRVKLLGWVNKLPVERSGEAIPLSEIAQSCRSSSAQILRILPDVVRSKQGSWKIVELTDEDVILDCDIGGAVVDSDPWRGW